MCKQLRSYQGKHLANRRTNLTIDLWLKGFVGRLLEMTHSQWIFRCISKHHHTNGALALKSREEVLARIEQQLDKGIEGLPTKDQWLLEIEAFELRDMDLRDQQYWLLAVEAARQVGENALKLSKGETSSWRDIMKNPLLSELLPTSTPLEEEEAPVGDQAVPEGAQESREKGQPAGEQLAERSKHASKGEPAVGAPTQQQAPAAQSSKKKKRRQTWLIDAETFAVGRGEASPSSSVRRQTKARHFGSLLQT